MPDKPMALTIPIPGGRIEALVLPGGPGRPLLVLGGVETGLRPLAGAEQAHVRRWARRTPGRSVVVMGRPLPDDPADAPSMLHPHASAEATLRGLRSLRGIAAPLAVEAESGGGRIALWLAVDHPDLVARLVLSSVASETPPDSAMAARMTEWIEMAERGDWGMFFSHMAVVMRPSSGGEAPAFDAAARLQPRPATPERFTAELRATLDPSSFVTDRLGEIAVPTLILAGGMDQVVPPDATRLVAERTPGARFEVDPACGHTVRSSFEGYDSLVEAFLAEGD